MKTIYITLLLTFTLISMSCKAQQPIQPPIIDIEELDLLDYTSGVYYKDINNFFNQFEGTWVYQNVDTTFTIVLQKKEKEAATNYFFDALEGDYIYSVNGQELINTITNADNITAIGSAKLYRYNWKPPCPECSPTNRRARLVFSDRGRNIHGRLTLRAMTVNGQPAIEALLWDSGVGTYDPTNPPPYFNMTVPEGKYILIKQ